MLGFSISILDLIREIIFLTFLGLLYTIQRKDTPNMLWPFALQIFIDFTYKCHVVQLFYSDIAARSVYSVQLQHEAFPAKQARVVRIVLEETSQNGCMIPQAQHTRPLGSALLKGIPCCTSADAAQNGGPSPTRHY